MMGRSHRILGALAGATFAVAQGQPRSVVAMTALVATATSSGPTSPDGDQTGQWWPALTGLAPKWVHRHRGLLHWWGLPVLAWVLVPRLDPQVQWAAHALLVGWLSHILGDAVFGRVPFTPWGTNVGLGLDTGGVLENGATWHLVGRRVRVPSLTRGVLLVALAVVLTVGTGLDLSPALDLAGQR